MNFPVWILNFTYFLLPFIFYLAVGSEAR